MTRIQNTIAFFTYVASIIVFDICSRTRYSSSLAEKPWLRLGGHLYRIDIIIMKYTKPPVFQCVFDI